MHGLPNLKITHIVTKFNLLTFNNYLAQTSSTILNSAAHHIFFYDIN